MSGPKVVTIVTREEIIAICESMIVNGGVKTGHGAEQKSATVASA